MKKSLYLIGMSLIMILSCSKEDDPIEVMKCNKSITPICKVTSKTTEDVYGSGLGNVMSDVMSYNSFGNQIRSESFLNGELLITWQNQQHDQFTNVIYSERYDSSGFMMGYDSIKFIAYDKPLEYVSVSHNSTTPKEITRYTYDSRGFLIHSQILFDSTIMYEMKSTQHDACGNIIYYDGFNMGVLYETMSASYLDYKKPLLRTIAHGTVTYIDEYSYNSNEHEISYKFIGKGTLVYEYKNYQHDQFGNITYYETFDQNGNMSEKITITYQCF